MSLIVNYTNTVHLIRTLALEDPEVNSFFVGEDKRLLDATRSDIRYPYFWLEYAEGNYFDMAPGQVQLSYDCKVYVAANSERDDMLTQEANMELCERIMMRFVRKLRLLYQQQQLVFDAKPAKWQPILVRQGDNNWGWEMRFTLRSITNKLCVATDDILQLASYYVDSDATGTLAFDLIVNGSAANTYTIEINQGVVNAIYLLSEQINAAENDVESFVFDNYLYIRSKTTDDSFVFTPGGTVSWNMGPVAPVPTTDNNGSPYPLTQAGVGLPAGGGSGQVLQKLSNTSYDVGWQDAQGGASIVQVEGSTIDFKTRDWQWYAMEEGDTPLNKSNVAIDLADAVAGAQAMFLYNDATPLSLDSKYQVLYNAFQPATDVIYKMLYVHPNHIQVAIERHGGFVSDTSDVNLLTFALQDIGGLTYLMNASDPSTLIARDDTTPPTNGQYLKEIQDASGNNLHAVQASDTEQPFYDATNKAVDFIDKGVLTMPGDIAFTSAAGSLVLAFQSPDTGSEFVLGNSSNPNMYIQLRDQRVNISTTWPLVIPTGYLKAGRYVIIISFENGNLRIWKNGETVEGGAILGGPTTHQFNFDMLANYSQSDFSLAWKSKGYIVAGYNKSLSEAEREVIFETINNEYAIY